jgi:hypothetical protein
MGKRIRETVDQRPKPDEEEQPFKVEERSMVYTWVNGEGRRKRTKISDGDKERVIEGEVYDVEPIIWWLKNVRWGKKGEGGATWANVALDVEVATGRRIGGTEVEVGWEKKARIVEKVVKAAWGMKLVGIKDQEGRWMEFEEALGEEKNQRGRWAKLGVPGVRGTSREPVWIGGEVTESLYVANMVMALKGDRKEKTVWMQGHKMDKTGNNFKVEWNSRDVMKTMEMIEDRRKAKEEGGERGAQEQHDGRRGKRSRREAGHGQKGRRRSDGKKEARQRGGDGKEDKRNR